MKVRGLWTPSGEFRQFAAAAKPPTVEIATRQMAEWTQTAAQLPNPDEVLRKLGYSTVALYRRLKSDARIFAAMNSRMVGLQSLDWEIRPGKAKAAHRDFIEEVFLGLDVPRILGNYVDAVFYGLAPMERRWEADGRYNRVTDLVLKPQEWFTYNQAGQPRFLQRGTLPQGVELEPYAFQIARHQATYQNPYGFAVLSCCWWPFIFKKGGIKFWSTFCEKWGMPHAFALIPPNTDPAKVDEYLEQLAGLVQDGVGVVADNAKVNLIEAAGKSGSGDLYRGLIEWANEEIVTALLGHQGTVSSTPGKLGQDETAWKVREEIVWADKNLAVREMQVLIRDLMDLNFGEGTAAPEFAFYEKEEVDKTLADRDAILAEKLRVDFTPEYLQEKHGLLPEHFTLRPVAAPPSADPTLPKEKTFAQGDPAELAQAVESIDALVDSIPDATLQDIMEKTLKPVFELVKSAQGYDDLRAGLLELFPDLDTEAFETLLTRAVALSEGQGRAV